MNEYKDSGIIDVRVIDFSKRNKRDLFAINRNLTQNEFYFISEELTEDKRYFLDIVKEVKNKNKPVVKVQIVHDRVVKLISPKQIERGLENCVNGELENILRAENKQWEDLEKLGLKCIPCDIKCFEKDGLRYFFEYKGIVGGFKYIGSCRVERNNFG